MRRCAELLNVFVCFRVVHGLERAVSLSLQPIFLTPNPSQ